MRASKEQSSEEWVPLRACRRIDGLEKTRLVSRGDYILIRLPTEVNRKNVTLIDELSSHLKAPRLTQASQT